MFADADDISGCADKSLDRPTSRSRRTEWIKVSFLKPICNSFLLTDAERKHVRRRALFKQYQDASCHQFISSYKTRRRGKLTQLIKEH
jgi:hypothetical protein